MQNLGPPQTSLWIGDLHINKVPGQVVVFEIQRARVVRSLDGFRRWRVQVGAFLSPMGPGREWQ